MKKCTYFVDGMDCPSCEVLIEKKIKSIKGVKKANASLKKSIVEIEYEGTSMGIEKINDEFKSTGYTFKEEKCESKKKVSFQDGKLIIDRKWMVNVAKGVLIALIVVVIFELLENSKLGSLVSISKDSPLPTFFLFGLIAGISSCFAVVGGLLLSLSVQWENIYAKDQKHRTTPFLMFNIARLLAFAVGGVALGYLGKSLGLSLPNNPIITVILFVLISLYMLILGLQMLGVKWLSKIHIKTPKFLSKRISDERKFRGKYMPFLVGALTFFLPCGFTLNAQTIALSLGNPIKGGLILLFFALGTLPLLALISFSSITLSSKPKLKKTFELVAGILVVVFAIYNLNSQLNVLGLPSLSDLKSRFSFTQNSAIVSGKSQTLKTVASNSGYYPENATVKAGVPIVWEITDDGATGCTNGIISKQLFGNSQVTLKKGLNTVNLPALAKGYYKYSCTMGMYSGTITAI